MSSEEKNLPATSKKLKDARKKGQVAHFKDFTTAIVFLATVGLLYMQFRSFQVFLSSGLVSAIDHIDRPFNEAVQALLGSLFLGAVAQLTPLMVLLVSAVILIGIVMNGGFLFSAEALTPKLSHLDPIKGIGRVFGVRSIIELVKSLIKLLVMSLILWLIIMEIVPSLPYLPPCGMACFDGVVRASVVYIMGAASIAYLIIGSADIVVQKWLFGRDQKMSKTELKQERKDSDGSPEVKSAQRQLRQEIANAPPGKLSIERATIVIYGRDAAVALRYVADETGVPLIMARARGDKAMALVRKSYKHQIPLCNNKDLALSLLTGSSPGQPIKPKDYQGVAMAIQRPPQA